MKNLSSYIIEKWKYLGETKNKRLLRVFAKSLQRMDIYLINDPATGSKYAMRITDKSYFKEYYEKFRYFYESKSYFVWYRECFRPVKKKENLTKKRNYILERDGYMCVVCKSREHLTLDHIKPGAVSKDNTFYNLVTMCRYCNHEKSNADWGDHFITDVVIPHIKRIKNDKH